jgi:hypothetical protein
MWIEAEANGEIPERGHDRTRHCRGHDPDSAHAIGGIRGDLHRSAEEGVDALTTRTGGVE